MVSENINEGTVEVQYDYDLLCFDFVSTPSTHGAFLSPSAYAELINFEKCFQRNEIFCFEYLKPS